MNFEFQNPTRLIFGAGTLSRLGEVVRAHGTRALVVTGGGSVKKSGVFDRAVSSLKASGYDRGGYYRGAQGCFVMKRGFATVNTGEITNIISSQLRR